MRITRVYTKKGDKGETTLSGGQKVLKDDIRIEAYGTVDELNAIIGVVRAFNQELPNQLAEAHTLDSELHRIQNRLFDIGGILATLSEDQAKFKNMPNLTEEEVVYLENLIDRCQEVLSPLEEFILPSGGPVVAHLHQGRTVCRRAERLCIALNKKEPIDPVIIKYLNRLSDALFVLARWIGKAQGEQEVLWKRPARAEELGNARSLEIIDG